MNLDPRRSTQAHPGFECGELRVEARDEANRPVESFAWADCVPMRGNTANGPNSSRPVQWGEGRSLAELSGRRLRLAFQLRDAHLFSLRAERSLA